MKWPKLKVILLNELPPDIISSDKAAYRPHEQTIYMRKGEGLKVLCHELKHWLIDVLGMPKEWHKCKLR